MPISLQSRRMQLVVLIVSIIWAFASGQPNAEFEAYKASHPEEFSGKFEGDIDNPVQPNGFRNARIGKKKWRYGIVYYNFTGTTYYTQVKVKDALADLQSKVGPCIKFQQRVNEPHYVQVINGRGCYSTVGRAGGKQMLSLADPGCLSRGTIQHEFMHALGFAHEQSRSDRDDYLDLHLENVQESMKHNFNKFNTDNLDLPYEYGSVMHYGKYAFSINGRPTMTPKKPGVEIGLRKLHSRDVEMIRRHYGCNTDNNENIYGECVDEQTDCLQKKYMCWDDQFRSYMARVCEKTCGACEGTDIGPPECLDHTTDCWKISRLCHRPKVRSLCQKTCGACDETFP